MDLLPTTNADGRDVVPMTEAQKYLFDLKGFILLPALLSGEELVSIRAHQMKFLYERESLPPDERDNHGGPSQILLDHPAVVGVLNEVLSHQALASEECYGFRYDHTYTSHRQAGHDNFGPHGGGGYFNFRGNSHIYQMQSGKVHSGLTRVVWELNQVSAGDGGTLFLPGSHKAAFLSARRVERARQCAVGKLYLSGWFGGDFHRGPVPFGDALDQRAARPAEFVHLLRHRQFQVGQRAVRRPK